MEKDLNMDAKPGLELLLEESSLKGARRAERYPSRRFFGFFCSYWPEELVLAAGLEPFRLLPQVSGATPAELPAYSCSLARGCLAAALEGQCQDLAGVGFAHTCDTMQSLGGIWKDAVPGLPVLFMVPPVRLDAPGAQKYFKSQLLAMRRGLETISGRRIGDEDLGRAVKLCQRIRSQAGELDKLRPGLPSHLTAAVMRAGQVMPREAYAKTLDAAMPLLREMAAGPGGRVRLMVSGAVMEDDGLFQMLEGLGGRVVADDTCTGYRHYQDPAAAEETDLLDAIVQRFTRMPPCPCRCRALDERIDYLEDLARERQAQGVLLVIRKYCEPHAWDSVPLSDRLRKKGTRTMVLELEGSDIGGPERTRLQAFLESLY